MSTLTKIMSALVMVLAVSSVQAEQQYFDFPWGAAAATCPDNGWAGKVRIDASVKEGEFLAAVDAGECIVFLAPYDAVDADGWVYNSPNFVAMTQAIDAFDANYFGLFGEALEVHLEVFRDDSGFLIYNDTTEIDAVKASLAQVKAELATAKLDLAAAKNAKKGLGRKIKALKQDLSWTRNELLNCESMFNW